jgi:hypothetical protein
VLLLIDLPFAAGETERVRVLYIGEPLSSPLTYFVALINDPFFDVTPVQAFTYNLPDEIAWRSVRRYMPRNYELLSAYDAITLVYADAKLFKPEWRSWFSWSVVDGVGFTFTGQEVAKHQFLWEWLESTVGDVLPVERPGVVKFDMSENPSRIRVVKPEHPIMKFLPWSTIGRHGNFYDTTRISTKLGSETIAEHVTTFGKTQPFLVWWDVEKGRSLAILTRFSSENRNPSDPFFEWPYLADFSANFHLYMAQRPVPQEVEVIHLIRTTTIEAWRVKNTLVSSIDFIAKLGGNTRRLEDMLREADEKLVESKRMYLDYEFQEALALLEDMADDMDDIVIATIEVKDQTFMSIYMVEWSVLMSTSMITGVVVWSLMVRRRLYREAGSTRAIMD